MVASSFIFLILLGRHEVGCHNMERVRKISELRQSHTCHCKCAREMDHLNFQAGKERDSG